MRTFKLTIMVCFLIVLALGFGNAGRVVGQDYAKGVVGLIYMDRGVIWDQFTGRSHGAGAVFAWYQKMMDYPGFEPGLVKANVGDWPSHEYGNGWGYAALRAPGIYPASDPHPTNDVLGVSTNEEYLVGNTNWADTSQSLVQDVCNRRWLNGENYFLKKNPLEAEEIIDSECSWNPNYRFGPTDQPSLRQFLPIKRTYTLRQWTGARQDQKYLIETLTIKNVSDDPRMDWGKNFTLYDFYVMRNHYFAINRRSWVLQGGTGGVAKDQDYVWDQQRNAMFLWAGDWRDPLSVRDETYNFVGGIGPTKQGEWAASGHVGIGFLYASPNKFGEETKTANFWNAIANNPGMGTDQPYQGVQPYLCVADGRRTVFFLSHDPRSKEFGNAIFSQHYSAGPYDLAPGQEIKIIDFQGINGVDLEVAMMLTKTATKEQIATGIDSIKMLWDKAKLTTLMAMKNGYATGGAMYKGWNHPDPPACPYDFTIAPYRGDDATLGNVPGNIISWSDWADNQPDADYTGDEALDLESYTVWKSDYVAFMGWYPIANIKKKAAANYNAATKTYKFTDTKVNIGFSYYYAISAADAGHATWPPRPQAITEFPLVFPGGKVPPQQSGLQASLNYTLNKSKWTAFRTQRTPGNKLSDVRVFPNPFVMRAGYINPTDEDGIHFANIPADCEIRVYTIRGDLVATGPGTIEMSQDKGSGEAVWKQLTKSEQFTESGMYFYIIEAKSGADKGKTATGKFVIIR